MTLAPPDTDPSVTLDADPVEASLDADITLTSGVRGLIEFAKPAAGRFALSGLLAAIAALASLLPFWAIYRTVDELISGDPTRSDLWRLAFIALVAVVGRFVVFGAALMLSHVAAYEMLYGIRIGIADRLGRVPLGDVTAKRSGEIKKVMGEDVERLELFLAHGIPDAVSTAVVMIAVPVWLFTVDWRMAIATIIVVVPAFAVMGIAVRRAMPEMSEFHESTATMNSTIVELIRGMPVVKVFNRGTDRAREAERAIAYHVESVKRYSLDFLPLGTAFYVLLAANVVIIVPLGLWLNDRGSLSDTDLLFFFIVGLGALVPIVSLLNLFAYLARLTTGGNLVSELMQAPTLDEHVSGATPARHSVEFRQVGFGYGERRVLDDVTFHAEPNTITALVGPSGAGKTTIASLVARFWDVDDGAILIGDVDIREIDPDTLAAHVAVVFQDTFLFDDTIAANLRIANPDATDDQVAAAARAAQAEPFVRALPDGYQTMVGERGARLSGGERQRLTLARAILADCPIIVLDEATSFADPENEALLQDALDELVDGKTVIMIAHRLSTIAGADQILVVDGGHIVERGRHDELRHAGGQYAELWNDFVAAGSISLGNAVRRTTAETENGAQR